MRNQDKYNTDNVRVILEKDGFFVMDEYVDAKTKILCKDNDGYYIYIILSNYLTRHGIGRRFDKSNDYSIVNINLYLQKQRLQFECISEKYESSTSLLDFKCNRCCDIIQTPWRNVNKNDKSNRNHIICPNCDGRNESVHASVLKQMFVHYYPDTITEDKTYVNPITNKICPTDIVNHRLKIAVEIQSQWHDFDDIKRKDKMKKQFWLDKGYTFYDPDIRDYSILEMCKLFFDIEELPPWINYELGKKLNIKKIQEMLNKNITILNIAKCLDINPHRIYDAIHSKKLFYPKNYKYINTVKPEYIL